MPGRKTHVALAAALALSVLAGCTHESPSPRPAPALRVAVPGESPPYAFHQGQNGLEVDFAHELAAALGRPLTLVPLDFGDIIPAVSAGRADMAMAGLTITPAREVQIAFSAPYLRSGLIATMRREDTKSYSTVDSVLRTRSPIGVVGGTTGERFVRERAPRASVAVYPTAFAAMNELGQRRVDLVIHDAPVGIWFASRDEANLAVLPKLLNEEQLGWGIRRGDEALRADVDRVLAHWQADGTRDRILARWLPYWQRLEGARPSR